MDIRADRQQQTLADLNDKLKALDTSRWKVGAAQSFSNANSCVSRRVVNLLVGNDINYDAVSYTHLDVYKRQVLFFLLELS